MSYHSKILKKIEHSDWPDFERNDFLGELHDLAVSLYEKRSIEGYLASFLIFQQLSEEILKLLIQHSNFFMQLSVFPQEYAPPKTGGKTFGYLIGELESSVCDKKTKNLIKKAKDLNSLRINLVHKIALKTSVSDIRRQAKSARGLYDKILELFLDIRDKYHVSFSKYSDDLNNYKELATEYLVDE